jgi:AraC-like DNA-binding protein
MKSISEASGFNRITILLSILEIIASKNEFQLLTGPVVREIINNNDSDRLNKVYKYTVNNYHQELTLETVAAIANLSVSAFCRYFKKRTNKTFIQFLNEIRITHACHFLTEEELTVTSVCYNCGYTSVSYFIKKFKEIIGQTPLTYQKRFNNKVIT